MLHHRDKQAKGLFKPKMCSFLLFCFTYLFLVHSTCMGAEEALKETDSPKTTRSRESFSISVSFDTNSDSSNSPTSSNQSRSSRNSSLNPQKSTRESVDPSNGENEPTVPPREKKRNKLARSLSYRKTKEMRTKSGQKSSSIKEETKLSLSDLLAETTAVLQEDDGKKEIAEEILSSFVDEKAVFAALIDLEGTPFKKLEGTYPHTIIIPLRELIFCKFLGRVENLKLRFAEYDERIKSISTSALLPTEIEPPKSTNYSELIYPPESEKTNDFPSWERSHVRQLAAALYLRDAAVFQDIDPNDVLRSFLNKDHASKETILTLTKNYNATADLWAYQILTEQNEKKRETLIANITLLGRYLYMTHNYQGTSQVNACFAKRSVRRLWERNPALNPLGLDSNWSTVSEALTPRGNYKAYREQLTKFQDDPGYLPDFTVIMHDLQNSFEKFEQEPHLGLPALAISLEPLLKFKTLFSSESFLSLIQKEAQNPFLKIICGLSEINEDVLDELSLRTTRS